MANIKPEYQASLLKVEATGDPERLRSAYQTVRRHIPGEGISSQSPQSEPHKCGFFILLTQKMCNSKGQRL